MNEHMKERPILFSAPMVRAILDGTKTQTRRVLNIKPYPFCEPEFLDGNHISFRDDVFDAESEKLMAADWFVNCEGQEEDGYAPINCPYGKVGDRLWVRETWHCEGMEPLIRYKASGDALHELKKWKPSIHMPRWASRINLEITGVRVERLQEISEADAIAEGAGGDVTITPCYSVDRYKSLWESINGTGSWDANPWVWVIEFKRVDA